MDVGSSVHIMIHQTGIIEELELEKYGLEYIDMDPIMSYPVPTGKGVIHFWKDVERTLESISKVAPEDVKNYKGFIKFWGKINKGVLKTFMSSPTGPGIVSTMVSAGPVPLRTIYAVWLLAGWMVFTNMDLVPGT